MLQSLVKLALVHPSKNRVPVPVHVSITRVLVHSATAMSAIESLKKHGVIPDVIDEFTPQTELHVTYPAGALKYGNELAVSGTYSLSNFSINFSADVQKQPKIEWKADSSKLHTLVKVDPDAPSRRDPKFGQWRHWVVVNIPGSDLSKGDVLSSYAGAGPPQGSGLHRYVFLLYEQNAKMSASPMNDAGKGRANWNIKKWAQEHNLHGPIAANFYQAQNL